MRQFARYRHREGTKSTISPDRPQRDDRQALVSAAQIDSRQLDVATNVALGAKVGINNHLRIGEGARSRR